MRRFVFSTDDFPEVERFAVWRETVSSGLFGTSPEKPEKEREGAFNAWVEAWVGGEVAYVNYRMDPCHVRRQLQDIARVSWADHVLLYRNRSDDVLINCGGTEFLARRGDMFVADPTLSIDAQAITNFDGEVMFVPRAMLEPHLSVSGLRGILNPNGGATRLTKTFLDGFVRELPTLDARELVGVADTFCRLLALAFGGAPGEQGEAVRSARLLEVKRYVELNIADPALMPEKAALALKMSPRQLHLVFEPSGTSFNRYVLRRRLEECRTALIANPARPVTDIAFGWGFKSLATFYRAFQAAFGMAPGELRQQAKPTVSSMGE